MNEVFIFGAYLLGGLICQGQSKMYNNIKIHSLIWEIYLFDAERFTFNVVLQHSILIY